MNFKTTYILAGILVAELVVFGIMLSLKKAGPKEDVFPTLNEKDHAIPTKDITRVEIEQMHGQPEKLVFVQNGSDWRLEQPAVRIESSLVNQIIDGVRKAKREEDADVTPNLSQFGLEPPAARVTLIKGDGEGERRWTLNIGNESIGGASSVVYVTSSDRDDGKEVLAIRRSQLDALLKPVQDRLPGSMLEGPSPPQLKTVNDFRTKTLLAESAIDILSVDLLEPGHEEVGLKKDTKTNRWRSKPPSYGEAEEEGESLPGPHQTSKQTGVKGLLDALVLLRVNSDDDFKENNASDKDLADKGLTDKPATMRIAVERYAGGGFLMGGANKPPVTEVLLIGKAADPKGEKYYARLASDRSVVLVSAKDLEPIKELIAKPEALRERNLLAFGDRDIDAVNIQHGKETLKLRRTSPVTWKLVEGNGKLVNLDAAAVKGLLRALSGKRQIEDFPKSDSNAGLNQPKAQISIWVNGLEPQPKPDAEPKLKDESKPTVQLTFGNTYKVGTKELMYVRRKNEFGETPLGVPVSPLLAKVEESRLAYLDRTLPEFKVDDVTKLVLVRDVVTYELVKSDKQPESGQPQWTIKEPKELAGRGANDALVNDILRTLAGLRPEKLVAENVTTADDLAKYSLSKDKTGFQITLTLQLPDKKTEERTYQFGSKTGSGLYGRLIAKAEDRRMVFVVPDTALDPLKQELRDPLILRFSPDKVKQVTLVGWQKPGLKDPTTLVFERTKDGRTWSATGVKLARVNNQKVDDFLQGLSTLPAQEFIKGPAKPEYTLEVKDGALKIELLLDDNKTRLTLYVSPKGPGGNHYAESTPSPKEVFVVRPDLFKQLLEGPEYFGK